MLHFYNLLERELSLRREVLTEHPLFRGFLVFEDTGAIVSIDQNF